MRNNNFNLQILHHDKVFPTREVAIAYLQDYYKPNSLEGEPVMVKYTSQNPLASPNVIIAFGTSSQAPGSFYFIDFAKLTEDVENLAQTVESNTEELTTLSNDLTSTINAAGLTYDPERVANRVSYQHDATDAVIGAATNIAQAVQLLSTYVQNTFEGIELTVQNTDSISLVYAVNPSGGMKLSAGVKISTVSNTIDSVIVNDNIIGIKSDGLYAAVDLSFDDLRRELTFVTSGYVDGQFREDAVTKIIPIGEHTSIVTNNEDKTIALTSTKSGSQYTLSGDVKLSENVENIAKINNHKLYVDGRASNISYNNTTVASELGTINSTLTTHTRDIQTAHDFANVTGNETSTAIVTTTNQPDGGKVITTDVKLGTHNSIIPTATGIEADVSVSVDTVTNILSLTVGDRTTTHQLPGVGIVSKTGYDDVEQEIWIRFSGTTNVLRIPVSKIMRFLEVNNPANSPVVLTKTVESQNSQTDILSARLKLLDTRDNLITVNNNGYMSVSQTTIQGMIDTEQTRAQTAEANLENAITAEQTRATGVETALNTSIQNLNASLTTEVNRATNREGELHAEIVNVESAINVINGNAQTSGSFAKGDADTLTAAKNYATQQDTATLNAAKAYADDAVTLKSNGGLNKDDAGLEVSVDGVSVQIQNGQLVSVIPSNYVYDCGEY